MAGSIGRSISIGLSANTKNFAKSLRSAEKNLERFKTGVRVLSTAVAASFAAMGAAALVFGKSAVDAAIADDKAQKQLAKTIKNNTKVTQAYQHTVEKSVTALQDQFNIADDKLRPAFNKLITATKSVSKSQKLMRTALDVSAGTGKDLETVASALSRAYLGNNTALGKLGVGISKAQLEAMSFNEIINMLNKNMGGQAKEAAGSYAGQLEGLKIAWSEFQEGVGYKLLPYLKTLLTWVKTEFFPFLEQVKAGFSGTYDDKVTPKIKAMGRAMGLTPDGKPAGVTLGESLKRMADSFAELFKRLGGTEAGKTTTTLEDLANAMTKLADGITAVVDAVGKVGDVDAFFRKWNARLTNLILPGEDMPEVKGRATGGPVTRNTPFLVGESGPELFVPSGSGAIRTNRQTMGGGTTIINLNGIVDAESARRSIERLMRESSLRTGTVNLQGSIF